MTNHQLKDLVKYFKKKLITPTEAIELMQQLIDVIDRVTLIEMIKNA